MTSIIELFNNLKKTAGRLCVTVALLVGILMSSGVAKAQGKRFDLAAGYTGTYKGLMTGNGALATLAFNLPVGNGFSFMPEGGVAWQWINKTSDWNTNMVLRASVAYSVMYPRTQLTFFTGPRMNVHLFGHNELWVPTLNKYNTVSAAWQFGLLYRFERFIIKGAYSLPISNQATIFGKQVRPNVFEFSLGWCFSAEK